eukprot:GHVQ01024702.1.p2 GENE.GHVQ01024702.1~~GHVQ01024702.1.p2  ORF type:complete len:109 (+),score=14.25 GHVQ01024702.1:522-848(+)
MHKHSNSISSTAATATISTNIHTISHIYDNTRLHTVQQCVSTVQQMYSRTNSCTDVAHINIYIDIYTLIGMQHALTHTYKHHRHISKHWYTGCVVAAHEQATTVDYDN